MVKFGSKNLFLKQAYNPKVELHLQLQFMD